MENFAPETLEIMAKAWDIRSRNFRAEIEFDYPEATEVITLTGKQCALDCAHCGGHYLEGMKTVAEVGNSAKSCLLSGGCDSQGKVPFSSHLPFIEKLKKNRRLNFHVGLVNEQEIESLSRLADVVSFDFVADDETIQEVFGLDRKAEDYLQTYRSLRRKVKVLPHICLGLKGGVLAGERRALERLEQEGLDGLVFIVFIPTPGTRYEKRTPPSLEEVANILAEARIRFPDKPIFLGCMRPKGRYRQTLDQIALRCGVNKIVVPTRATVELAKQAGLEIKVGEECCVL